MEWTLQLLVLRDAAIAMMLGGVIGFERELKNRPAGFRTHMLVGGAAALLVGLGQLVIADHRLDSELRLTIDPLRLVEAVIAGVSFIGAGTIFARRGAQVVVGITTAASILMVAVIVQAILSWVNPYSPIGPLLNSLTQPFLRPLQKRVPMVANVDLSPLVLIIVLQLILMLPVAWLEMGVSRLF